MNSCHSYLPYIEWTELFECIKYGSDVHSFQPNLYIEHWIISINLYLDGRAVTLPRAIDCHTLNSKYLILDQSLVENTQISPTLPATNADMKSG